MAKPLIATCSLAGCFGCHMSLLDNDEWLPDLFTLVQFDRSPLTDIKHCAPQGVDIGLIEGGVCNTENVQVLREFRQQCKVLVAIGACALSGGVPALRNRLSVADCLHEAYLVGPGIEQAQIPSDPELPLLLDKVYALHELVPIDYFLPGCPPPAAAFRELLSAILQGRAPVLDYPLRRFD